VTEGRARDGYHRAMARSRSSFGVAVVAALAAAALSGCGSEGKSDSASDQVAEQEEQSVDRPGEGEQSGSTAPGSSTSASPASSAPVAPSALAAFAEPAKAVSSSSAPSCRNLRVTTSVRIALRRAHGNRDGPIEKGSVYYGRCGSTQYAIATFSEALADQPEKFRKLAGRRWVDKGDGFEAGCGDARRPIPRALVRLWRLCPTDG
jgi:hypothetical protein